jgi:hypothetical protein
MDGAATELGKLPEILHLLPSDGLGHVDYRSEPPDGHDDDGHWRQVRSVRRPLARLLPLLNVMALSNPPVKAQGRRFKAFGVPA